MLASSPSTRVACHAGLGIYYKEFIPGPPLRRLLRILHGSRAGRTWRGNEALRLSGFTAPENLARGRLDGGREYLFSRAVPGESVAHWLRRGLDGRDGASLAMRRDLLRALGTLVGRFHAAGFIHGNLRPRHVLASFKGGQFRLGLIDNEGNRLRRPPPGKAILRNLVELNQLAPEDLTRTDRWRCFLAWRQQHPELGHLEARLLAAEAYRLALRRGNGGR